MEMIADIVKDIKQLGAVEVLKVLGLSSGEITQRQVVEVYGNWAKEAIRAGRLVPVRQGAGRTSTKWYSVSDILELRAKDSAAAYLQDKILNQ